MSLDDMMLRKEIAISIIERCNHGSLDSTPCSPCIDAAKVAIEGSMFENQVDFE